MPVNYETAFTRDVLGRYTMNTWQEAIDSTDPNPPGKPPRPDARKFDIVIVGGGAFGAALAHHIFEHDRKHSHRILVLEEGPLLLPEHVQNMPLVDLGGPPFGGDAWKTPWRRNVGGTGLAACVGGRSIFFGGWAPQLLEDETAAHWPQAVLDDLRQPDGYFRQASEQIGVTETNDFVFGHLHEKMREQLFCALKNNDVPAAIPLDEMPLHLDVPADTSPEQRNRLKIEAPLAVQARGPRSGFFPVNKYSSVPLLLRATRLAEAEVPGVDDVKKRLMIVPYVHVTELITREVNGEREVFQLKVRLLNEGNREETYEVLDGVRVVLANSTIESTRLAKESFAVLPTFNLMGQNHIAHLRSNITIRVPREAIEGLCSCEDLQSSALLVKCRHPFGEGQPFGYFHFQITSAGASQLTTDSELQLFKKIPDIDTLDRFDEADESHVVITIRGIGEMEPKRNDPNNSVTLLENDRDAFDKRLAFASIEASQRDFALWKAMDDASNQLAEVFANGRSYQVLTPLGYVDVSPGSDLEAILPYEQGPHGSRRDQLDTTHHEAGTLWMGDEQMESVTDTDCRIKGTSNCYVCGPALFPSVGSPNPMLTGVALARRLGDHLIGSQTPFTGEAGFTTLFDGIDTSKWRMSTIRGEQTSDHPGGFVVVDGVLESVPGSDIGLYWCTIPTPPNFILKLEWRQWFDQGNSGVFLRFPNPDTFVPQHQNRRYERSAYIGVNFGFEVQIDQNDPDPQRRTGAIYNFQAPVDPQNTPVKEIGQWNTYEIHVKDQTYKVILNDQEITTFTYTPGSEPEFPERGLPSTSEMPRYIGLQTHGNPFPSRVGFRGIRIKEIP